MSNELFENFKKENDVSQRLCGKYRNVLPAELIEIWENYGFGELFDGYLKLINPEEYQELIERVSTATEQLALAGSNNYQAEIERTLMGLGFLRTDFDRPTAEFSGGWRMRIELAKLLLQHHDVLLLDEPTNHLDIESIQWLENFLASVISRTKRLMSRMRY